MFFNLGVKITIGLTDVIEAIANVTISVNLKRAHLKVSISKEVKPMLMLKQYYLDIMFTLLIWELANFRFNLGLKFKDH